MKLRFVIPVEPKPKVGKRHAVRGGKAIAFSPKQDVDNERSLRQWVREQLPSDWSEPLAGPMRLRFTAYLRAPKSIPKYKIGHVFPIGRPDLKNLEFLLEDGALNGLVVIDDSQFVEIHAFKAYAWNGIPRWEIEVESVV